MRKKNLHYEQVVTIENLMNVYQTIKTNTKHKDKIFLFELFFSCNIMHIYQLLIRGTYHHQNYHIFIIKEPKYRLIMSEVMTDKIINHFVSTYFLFPLLDPLLIPTNVATRPLKGTSKGIFYVKKYINQMKVHHDKIYVLKCDICKYFYSIDHEILLQKLDKLIEDKRIYQLVKEIITSTDEAYISSEIDKVITNEMENLKKLSIKDYDAHVASLQALPHYQKGKGLPIGNMTSQILAVYYLNDLDHFIKEKLGIKCYVRYMDDFILFHEDKNYLRDCLNKIEQQLEKLKLKLNHKTQIVEMHHGFCFLGYRFVLRDKKLLVLLNGKTKQRIKKRIHYLEKHEPQKLEQTLASYHGYFKNANSKGFCFRNHFDRK